MVLFLLPCAAIVFSSPAASVWHKAQRAAAITLNSQPHDSLSEMAANWKRDYERLDHSAAQQRPIHSSFASESLFTHAAPIAVSPAVAVWAITLSVALLAFVPTIAPVIAANTHSAGLLLATVLALVIAEALATVLALVIAPPSTSEAKPPPELSRSSAMAAPSPSYEECLILGEESAKDGTAWYLCSSKPDDSSIECAEDYGAIADADPNSGGHDWVCKVPKVMWA